MLVVPVPALEDFVRARWRHYEPAWVSTDPAFVHAHVTALAPWVTHPSSADLSAVAHIAAHTPAFEFTLDEVAAFPDGVIHAPPQPATAFRALTAALAEAFPGCPPYGGAFGSLAELVPHLTLDHAAGGARREDVAAMLADVLPLAVRAERLDWQWYDEGGCRLMRSWALPA